MTDHVIDQDQQEQSEKRGASRYKSFWELDEQDKFNLFRAIGLVANFRRKALGELSLDSAVLLLMAAVMKMESTEQTIGYLGEACGLKTEPLIVAIKELGVTIVKARGGYSVTCSDPANALISCETGVTKDFLVLNLALSAKGMKFIEEISRMSIFN